MIRVEVSDKIRAPQAYVVNTYRDFRGWPKLFAETIRGVRLIGEEHGTEVLEIDHVEGKVINKLRIVSPEVIELEEHKKRFDAHFENCFDPLADGTRYTVAATIKLKRVFKLLEPFIRPYVRMQISRFVIEPIKRATERHQ
jgi:hypothetical protein